MRATTRNGSWPCTSPQHRWVTWSQPTAIRWRSPPLSIATAWSRWPSSKAPASPAPRYTRRDLLRAPEPAGYNPEKMTAVPFVKASACGNDFLLIDGMHAPGDLAGFTRRICDRHRGIGADGVEWLFPSPDADVRARLLNADGSEAEISGNGTRCVAAYLCSEQAKERVQIRTGAGVKT